MRAGLRIALVAVLGTPSLLNAEQPEKPAFEFKGYTAGVAVDPTQTADCRTQGDSVVCSNYEDQIAGRAAVTSIDFYQGKLSSVFALINRNHYSAVLTALEAKYGTPCRSSIENWQNGMGASLDNPQSVWCFNSGELTVREIGYTLDDMYFSYWDENQPAPEKPKVDF